MITHLFRILVTLKYVKKDGKYLIKEQVDYFSMQDLFTLTPLGRPVIVGIKTVGSYFGKLVGRTAHYFGWI